MRQYSNDKKEKLKIVSQQMDLTKVQEKVDSFSTADFKDANGGVLDDSSIKAAVLGLLEMTLLFSTTEENGEQKIASHADYLKDIFQEAQELEKEAMERMEAYANGSMDIAPTSLSDKLAQLPIKSEAGDPRSFYRVVLSDDNSAVRLKGVQLVEKEDGSLEWSEFPAGSLQEAKGGLPTVCDQSTSCVTKTYSLMAEEGPQGQPPYPGTEGGDMTEQDSQGYPPYPGTEGGDMTEQDSQGYPPYPGTEGGDVDAAGTSTDKMKLNFASRSADKEESNTQVCEQNAKGEVECYDDTQDGMAEGEPTGSSEVVEGAPVEGGELMEGEQGQGDFPNPPEQEGQPMEGDKEAYASQKIWSHSFTDADGNTSQEQIMYLDYRDMSEKSVGLHSLLSERLMGKIMENKIISKDILRTKMSLVQDSQLVYIDLIIMGTDMGETKEMILFNKEAAQSLVNAFSEDL